MENLQRDLGRLRREYAKSPLPEQVARETWSLVVVGSRGRILGFSVKRGVVICFFMLVFFLCVGAALLYSLRTGWEHTELRAIPRGELDQLRRENHHLMARIAVLETLLGDREASHGVKAGGGSSELSAEGVTAENEGGEGLPAEAMGNNEGVEGVVLQGNHPRQPEASIQKVAIDDYAAKILGKEYRVSFSIRNLVNDTGVSGYIISVLIPENPSVSHHRVSPPVALQEGRPLEPLSGQFFSIRKFKDVRLIFQDIDIRQFGKNRVFVYNEAGFLLHEQDFEVMPSL